jgi:hypothetical protein
MNKKYWFLLLIFSLTNSLFSVELYRYVGYSESIKISDKTLVYDYDVDDSKSKEEKYDINSEIINKILFITFDYTGEFLGKNVSHGIKRYLVLYDDYGAYLLFYDNNNNLVFFAESRTSFGENSSDIAKASSELKENGIVYSASNLTKKEKLIPWAEGVDGSGVGQKIVIENSYFAVNHFAVLISNGYIDYSKQYLYENNNRVKKIRVHKGNDYVDFELKDTPNLQCFYFNKELTTESNKFEIEILEVYNGDKWDDTCINEIIAWS